MRSVHICTVHSLCTISVGLIEIVHRHNLCTISVGLTEIVHRLCTFSVDFTEIESLNKISVQDFSLAIKKSQEHQ